MTPRSPASGAGVRQNGRRTLSHGPLKKDVVVPTMANAPATLAVACVVRKAEDGGCRSKWNAVSGTVVPICCLPSTAKSPAAIPGAETACANFRAVAFYHRYARLSDMLIVCRVARGQADRQGAGFFPPFRDGFDLKREGRFKTSLQTLRCDRKALPPWCAQP